METIGLPKELYEKVTAICELEAAFDYGMRNVFGAKTTPYDIDVKERLASLRKDLSKLLSENKYSHFVDVVNKLLDSDEQSSMTRIHDLHFYFYKLD